jgi:hypothetical protein
MPSRGVHPITQVEPYPAWARWREYSSGRKVLQETADCGPQGCDGALGGFAQQRLQLCEELLDRVEIGRVERKVEQDGSGRFDRITHTGDFVSAQIVHHHDIAGR